MRFLKRHKGFLVFLFIILVWLAVLFFVSPGEVVDAIGLETGYLLLFLTALIGVSGLSSALFYATLLTFLASGEFNIFLVIMIVAPTMAFGDAVFFFLGYKGHSAINELTGNRLKSFSSWLNSKSQWFVVAFAYLYTSTMPLPQDILMVALGLGRVNFPYVFAAVLLGNATFVTLIYFFMLGILPKLDFIL